MMTDEDDDKDLYDYPFSDDDGDDGDDGDDDERPLEEQIVQIGDRQWTLKFLPDELFDQLIAKHEAFVVELKAIRARQEPMPLPDELTSIAAI